MNFLNDKDGNFSVFRLLVGLAIVYVVGMSADRFIRSRGDDVASEPTRRPQATRASAFTDGQAITRCEAEVEKTLGVNADFEGAFAIGFNERIESLPNDRFRIQSWYDIGDGVERRYTCVISFTEKGNPDKYGAVVSDGW